MAIKKRKRKYNLNANVYIKGKFSTKRYRTIECEGTVLYAKGRYRTSLTPDMLTDGYIQVDSPLFWNAEAYVKCDNVKDIYFTMCKDNNLFRNDYLYISYNDKIEEYQYPHGWTKVKGDDVCISGYDIVSVLLYIEKLNPELDTSQVRKSIHRKLEYLQKCHPDALDEILEGQSETDIIKFCIINDMIQWQTGRYEDLWQIFKQDYIEFNYPELVNTTSANQCLQNETVSANDASLTKQNNDTVKQTDNHMESDSDTESDNEELTDDDSLSEIFIDDVQDAVVDTASVTDIKDALKATDTYIARHNSRTGLTACFRDKGQSKPAYQLNGSVTLAPPTGDSKSSDTGRPAVAVSNKYAAFFSKKEADNNGKM